MVFHNMKFSINMNYTINILCIYKTSCFWNEMNNYQGVKRNLVLDSCNLVWENRFKSILNVMVCMFDNTVFSKGYRNIALELKK